MYFSEDFRKLLAVCLKMLFRKSTRKRFVCLVVVFLAMMGFNTYSYVNKFHKAEIQKKEVLEEKAFKVFFLRMRTLNGFKRFLVQHTKQLKDFGSDIVKKAFIYQNNLFIHFLPPFEKQQINQAPEHVSLNLLYDMYNIRPLTTNFYVKGGSSDGSINVRNNYLDFNGARLSDDIIAGRHATLQFDLIDIADMIREGIWDRRIDIYNSIKKRIVSNIERVPLDQQYDPNPYLSRVETIVPLNLLYIFTNIKYDNTTDIIDLSESVRHKNGILSVDETLSAIPNVYRNKVMYFDINAFPRYAPLFITDLLKPQWNWLMYQNIKIKSAFMDYIDQLHFQGHYLFSYEKSHILKDRIKNINDDIRSNHIHFYLTDLSMGIAFPFMMSLFAFIHLKTEIAFLLMFKNRIREILFIFWLLPVCLMIAVKGGILLLYVLFLFFSGFGVTVYIVLPLSITILSAAAIFYPINQWCFSPFVGDILNLYAMHKGK